MTGVTGVTDLTGVTGVGETGVVGVDVFGVDVSVFGVFGVFGVAGCWLTPARGLAGTWLLDWLASGSWTVGDISRCREGTTQGCNLAMTMFGLGITPMICGLDISCRPPTAFALPSHLRRT